MKVSFLVLIAVIGVFVGAATFPLTSVQASCAPNAACGINTLDVTVAPQETQIGPLVGINTTYTNSLDRQITGIAIAVVQNSASQTLAVFTGSFTMAAGGSSPVYITFYPWLPSQTYTVQVYVVTPQGGVISIATKITITA